MIQFGFEPYPIEVILARDSVFSSAIVADEPWPSGVGAELRFTSVSGSPPVVWPATVTAETFSWDIPAAQVAEVLDGGAVHARLVYVTEMGTPILWGRGRTRVA